MTRKQALTFGTTMCAFMVLFMTIYNTALTNSWAHFSFVQLLVAFCIALALDLWLVGPLAKTIVARLRVEQWRKILLLSSLMVLGMAFCMSWYAVGMVYVTTGDVVDYGPVFARNFVFALPLQLLVVGPLVRLLFIRLAKRI